MLLSNSDSEVSFIANELAHCELEVFTNSESALNFFQDNHTYIRLLLLSTKIEDLHFLDIIDEFLFITDSVEIITISSDFESSEVITAMKKGVYDFVDLNSDSQHVKARVDSLLEKSFFPNSSISSSSDSLESKNQLINTLSLLNSLLIQNDFDSLDLSGISNMYTAWKKAELEKFGTPRLLIVEDEPEYNDMFYDFLSDDFDVYSVFDGESSMDIMKSETFDIILLDLFLPDISGADLASNFLQHNSDSKIIVITAFDITREVIDVMRSGAYDLLHKPVLKDDLFKAINSAWSDLTENRVIQKSEFEFFRKHLNDEHKNSLLQALFLYYKSKNRELRMYDIYLFYPELKKINFPSSFTLPSHVSVNSIGSFIKSIQSVDVSI